MCVCLCERGRERERERERERASEQKTVLHNAGIVAWTEVFCLGVCLPKQLVAVCLLM